MKTAAALFAFLLLATVPAAAQGPRPAPPFPPRFKIIFSNLCSGPEPWALHGHRVEFEYDENGGYITIEFFDTGFNSDILHSPRVLFNRGTGELTFSYADFSDEYLFKGFISSTELTGYFDDAQETIDLPRVPNSWPVSPPCQANGLALPPS